MNGKIEYFAENASHLQVVICEICHKYFNSRKQYADHLISKNHIKNEKAKTLLKSTVEIRTKQDSIIYEKDQNKKLNLSTNISLDFHSKSQSDDLKYELSIHTNNKGDNNIGSSSNEKSSVECVICQKYFLTLENGDADFNHKHKTENQAKAESLYNCYRDPNINKTVNVLEKFPENSLNDNIKEKLQSSKNDSEMFLQFAKSGNKQQIISNTNVSTNPEIVPKEQSQHKGAEMFNYLLKPNELKTFPGCDTCQIQSFENLVSFLNHSLTFKHCRRLATLQVKSTDALIYPKMQHLSTPNNLKGIHNQISVTDTKSQTYSPAVNTSVKIKNDKKLEGVPMTPDHDSKQCPMDFDETTKSKHCVKKNPSNDHDILFPNLQNFPSVLKKNPIMLPNIPVAENTSEEHLPSVEMGDIPLHSANECLQKQFPRLAAHFSNLRDLMYGLRWSLRNDGYGIY